MKESVSMKIDGYNDRDYLKNFELKLQLDGTLPMDEGSDEKQPEIKDGLTMIGRLDRDLAKGVIPEDLSYALGQDDFQRDRGVYRQGVMANMLPFGVGGSIFGLSLTEIPAIAAAVSLPVSFICAGIVAGATVGWLRHKFNHTGKVTVDLDGKKSTAPYYEHPEHYKKSPQMLRSIMTAKGVLGEKILPHTFKEGDIPSGLDPKKLDELRSYAKDLVKLEKDRRLVASFGKKSRYGKDALQLVDANMARDLIAGGKTVYVVNGKETTQVPHHYRADLLKGQNSEHIEAMTETFDYQETKFDYSLTPLKTPGDLSKVEKGTGIPEGIMGVYDGEQSYSEVVFRDKQFGYGKSDHGPRTSSEVFKYNHARESRVDDPSIKPSGSAEVKFVQRPNFPFLLGMTGAVAGGFTAMSLGLLGLPAAALMATGFVTGKFIGRKIF
jgi:hypothetical protein